jgi:hypothetical protein
MTQGSPPARFEGFMSGLATGALDESRVIIEGPRERLAGPGQNLSRCKSPAPVIHDRRVHYTIGEIERVIAELTLKKPRSVVGQARSERSRSRVTSAHRQRP